MTDPISDESKSVLGQLVELMPQYCYVDPSAQLTLSSAGYIEYSDDLPVEAGTGRTAARATLAGQAFLYPDTPVSEKVKEGYVTSVPVAVVEPIAEPKPEPTPAQAALDEVAQKDFAIYKGDPDMHKKRVKPRKAVYPFEQLEIGQLFFVPATKERPDPAKSLASTVSTASKRFATIDGEREVKNKKGAARMVPNYVYQRKFSVATIKKDSVCGDFTAPEDGAIVIRIEIPETS